MYYQRSGSIQPAIDVVLASAHLINFLAPDLFWKGQPTACGKRKDTRMVGMYRQGGIPSPQRVLPTSHPLALRELGGESRPDKLVQREMFNCDYGSVSRRGRS